MKHTMMRKRGMALLTALLFLLPVLFAQAESGASLPAAKSEVVAKLLEIIDFKFFVREDGIGRGTLPVYTAPSEDSLRLGDEKASCNVASETAVAGYVNGWLMVRYEIKDKKVRVGYIPPRYARACEANIGRINFDSIPAQTAEEITITDNPRDNSEPFGTLPADTELTILGKYTYTGNWWYVETTLNGQLTRGFIDRNEAAIRVDGEVYRGNQELGIPVKSPEGTEKIGTITVKGSDDNAWIVRQHSTRDSNMVARVYGGESFPCYGQETGGYGRVWYYIWVDGVWGWFSSTNATLAEGE